MESLDQDCSPAEELQTSQGRTHFAQRVRYIHCNIGA